MNKLLITKDTLIKGSLKQYNLESYFDTPNINRIFKDGAVFQNHFSAAPSTAMSISSIITGKYAFELGRKKYSKVSEYIGETLFTKASKLGFHCYLLVPDYWDGWLKYINAFENVEVIFYSKNELLDFSKFSDKLLEFNNEKTFLWIHLPHVIRPKNAYGSDIDLLDEFLGEVSSRNIFDDYYLTSDHGQMNLHKGIMNYGFDLYQNAINVPMISSRKADKVYIDNVTSHIDMYNIIFETAPFLRKYVISETAYEFQGHRKIAVMDNRFKLIYSKFFNRFELYDYLYDKNENFNILRIKKWDFMRGKFYYFNQVFFYPHYKLSENSRNYLMSIFDDVHTKDFFLVEAYLKFKVLIRFIVYPLINILKLRRFL